MNVARLFFAFAALILHHRRHSFSVRLLRGSDEQISDHLVILHASYLAWFMPWGAKPCHCAYDPDGLAVGYSIVCCAVSLRPFGVRAIKPTMIWDSKQSARTPELELAGWQKDNSQKVEF